jgi:hypothetical protein
MVIKVSAANKAIIKRISCEGQRKGTRSFVWENLKVINQYQDLYKEQDNAEVCWIEQALIYIRSNFHIFFRRASLSIYLIKLAYKVDVP